MLQLTSDKAVVGIDRIVLTARAGGLIPRLLDREVDLAALLLRLPRRSPMAPIAASTPRGCSRARNSAPTARSIRVRQ